MGHFGGVIELLGTRYRATSQTDRHGRNLRGHDETRYAWV